MSRLKKSVAAAWIILLMASVPVRGGEAPLTLREAADLAWRNEETVGLARKTVEEAGLQKSKALKSVFPDLEFLSAWDYRRNMPGGGAPLEETRNYSYTLSMNQPLYTGGRATSAMRSADKVIAISNYGYQLAREQVYLLAAQGYHDVLAAKRVEEASGQAVEQAAEFLKLAKARFELGEATVTSRLRAEFELSRRQNELMIARNALILARENLKKIIGRDFGDLADERGLAPPETEGLEALVNRALLSRKELLIARESVEIAREGIISARGKFLPYLYANGYYTRKGEDFPPDVGETWGVSINLSVPLYDRGWSMSDLALAKVALEKSEMELGQLRKNVRLEVEDRYYGLQVLGSSVESLKKQVALAEENDRGIRKQYEVGLATDLDVATAMTDLLSARVQLVRGEYGLAMAGLRLLQAAGMLALP